MNVISEFLQYHDYNKQQIFRWSCQYNHLDIAKWLIQTFSDIHNEIEYIFRDSCMNGDLQMAQWLISTFPDIDIYVYDQVFQESCVNGNLQMAQWLLSTFPNIDIHAWNEYAFRYSCYNGHLQVAKWLTTLSPYYYINYNNQPIIKIHNVWAIKHLQKQIRKFIRNKHYKKNQYILNEISLNPHKNVLGYKGYEYKKLEKRMKQELS